MHTEAPTVSSPLEWLIVFCSADKHTLANALEKVMVQHEALCVTALDGLLAVSMMCTLVCVLFICDNCVTA